MKKEDADYKQFSVGQFNGNPMIEALRPAIHIKEFTTKLTCKPNFETEGEVDDFSRELLVELLDYTYTVSPDLYVLYKTILKNILIGYLHRNPLSRDMKYEQYRVSVEKEYHFPMTKNLSKCISILGTSGAGKTLSVRQCFSLLPQVISHSCYQKTHLVVDQIVYIEFQAPVTKTVKGFILSFFLAVDMVIGTTYYSEWNKKSISLPVLTLEAKKVALNHYIGIAFVDEIQRCASANAKADMTTLEFIDDFFNSVGIPLIVAGTYKAMPLFKTTLSTPRRLSSARKFNIDAIENDLSNLKKGLQSFWFIFVNSFFHPKLLPSDLEFSEDFIEHVHYLTVGLPALATRLMRLAYEDAVEVGYDALTIELLNEVYRDQFDLLHPAIEALREKEYVGYENLLPISIFKPTYEQLVEQIIAKDIAFHEKQTALKNADEGETVELDKIVQEYIPVDDLRNLSGLTTAELAVKLGANNES
jgi:uncharacterized membrane protein